MQKTNLPLSSLKPSYGTKSIGQQNDCKKVKDEVNAYLANQCNNKYNQLLPCNDCECVNPNCPIINSPTNIKLLNTAYNGSGGVLAQDQRDLHWEAGEGTSASFPSVWIPAFVKKFGAAWASSPNPNADWISLYNNDQHAGLKDIYYRMQFYINSSMDHNNFALDLDIFADNSVFEIYVNGQKQSVHHPLLLPQSQSSDPYNYRGFDAGNELQITLSHDWKPCDNEIIIHIKSGAPAAGLLVHNHFRCQPSKFPDLMPNINISWGDSCCDCLETDDLEVLCICVSNPYSDVTFQNFIIHKITAVVVWGNPVPNLPDGTPSVDIHPIGPYCFGDIGPCSNNVPNTVCREFVLINRGAKSGIYKIVIEGICFEVCRTYSKSACFEMKLCKN